MMWSETTGARWRAALGITEPDRREIEARGEQLVKQAKTEHRAAYDSDPPEWSDHAGQAAAVAERGFAVPPPIASHELAARLRRLDPWMTIGVLPELPDAAIGRRYTGPDGRLTYSGSPEIVSRMQAADADRARRDG